MLAGGVPAAFAAAPGHLAPNQHPTAARPVERAPEHRATAADRRGPLTVAQLNHGRINAAGAPRVTPNAALGTLSRETPQKITISTSGQTAQYSFAATQGEHVTFDVGQTNWGSGGTARLHVFKPGGVWVTYFVLGSTPTYGDLDIDVSGTWNIVVDPDGTAVGSATVTLAGDVGNAPLTRGTQVTATTKYRGQQARYTFAATGGEHVTFDVPSTSWGGSTARLYLFGPGGRYVTYFTLAGSATYGDIDIDESGTWHVVLDPDQNAVGSARFTLAGDVTAALTAGTATTFAITYHGQNGRFTFPSTSGHTIRFSISGATWTALSGAGQAQLDLFRASANYVTSFPLGSTASTPSLTSDTTGTWIGLVNPRYSATGSVTITLTSS